MLIIPSNAASDAYQITRSLRFNSADSAYLSRAVTASGVTNDRRILTVFGWLKWCEFGTDLQTLYSSDSPDDAILWSGNKLRIYFAGAASGDVTFAPIKRDPGAWFPFMVAIDTTQATAANRHRVYFGNDEATYTGTAVTQNYDLGFTATTTVSIGRYQAGASRYCNCYLTHFSQVVGQQLTPASMGETSSLTNAFNPKDLSSLTFGTNGFWLKFEDNSNTTAATLGADSSGNGNNWTPNNFSVTAGVGNDSLTDTPTNYGTDTGAGGEVRGNFATLNPIRPAVGGTLPALANGNLKFTGVSTSSAISTQKLTGKVYWEAAYSVLATAVEYGIGRYNAVAHNGTQPGANTKWSLYYNTAYYWHDGATITEAVTGTPSGAWVTAATDFALFAIDVPNNKIWIGRNKAGTVTWAGGGDPAAGTVPTFGPSGGDGYYSTAVDLSTADWFAFLGSYDTGAWDINFGQRPFASTAPSGFKALCTQNLSDPALVKPSLFMDVNTRTGTGAAFNVTGKGFQPDLVWMKGRSGTTDHAIYDAVRTATKDLGSNLATDETTQAQGLTAFNSDGFSGGTLAKINTSAATYVDWMWKKGATSGIDVVSYTGNGANRTIAHALGVVPSMMIVKSRVTAGADTGWAVYHSALANTEYLKLETTAAKATGATYWNSTTPTSSVFSLGTAADTNTNNDTYINYLFAEVAGFSKFGSYVGNGIADGPFVFCGFRPRFILIKDASAETGWRIFDTARDTYNLSVKYFATNTTAAENPTANTTDIDILSPGFKIRGDAGTINTSGEVFVFAAFAEAPFKTARAR